MTTKTEMTDKILAEYGCTIEPGPVLQVLASQSQGDPVDGIIRRDCRRALAAAGVMPRELIGGEDAVDPAYPYWDGEQLHPGMGLPAVRVQIATSEQRPEAVRVILGGGSDTRTYDTLGDLRAYAGSHGLDTPYNQMWSAIYWRAVEVMAARAAR